MRRMLRILSLTLACCFVVTGTALAAAKKPVRIVYVEWPCAVVTTNIAKVVIEERLGRPCEILPVSVAVKFHSLALGGAPSTDAAWLPNTKDRHSAKEQSNVIALGPSTGHRRPGTVPLLSAP